MKTKDSNNTIQAIVEVLENNGWIHHEYRGWDNLNNVYCVAVNLWVEVAKEQEKKGNLKLDDFEEYAKAKCEAFDIVITTIEGMLKENDM